jgi:hypothetical protein
MFMYETAGFYLVLSNMTIDNSFDVGINILCEHTNNEKEVWQI